MKAAIPVVMSGTPDLDRFAEAVKQNVDGITGQQKNAKKLLPLPSTATLPEAIAQLNAILDRLQG